MRKIILMIAILFIFENLRSQTDFVNDSILYHNLYPSELSEFLKANPDALLIDVRTPGEFSDTSSKHSLNIGHLKGAVNIPIDSMEIKVNELKEHSDKPIVLYCSHSQRSRRFSKYLSENGFKKVYNLNGGMSHITQMNESEFPGKSELVVFGAAHKNLSVEEAVDLISANKDVLIIDVRPATEYNGTDSNEAYNVGKIKGAINIPYDDFKSNLVRLEQYKTNNILIYDVNGARSNPAAMYLTENGFTKVHNLIGGIFALHREGKTDAKQNILENKPKYNLLNVYETVNLLKSNSDLVILDVRPVDEYSNKADMGFHNLGRLKSSINIPPDKFASDFMQSVKDKKAKVLVYGMGDEPAKCAKMLTDAGYENVNLMQGGLWAMVSVYANVKGYKYIKDYMENYEGKY